MASLTRVLQHVANIENQLILDFKSQQLVGTIPPEIGQLAHLQFLYLNHNDLSGTIPASIGNLAKLQQLWLHKNQLSGAIPKSIGNLLDLQQLCLYENKISGIIPETIGNLVQMKYLFLHNNELLGSIPQSIGNLISLQRLSLTKNQLSGTIPTTIRNLENLQLLWLHKNKLSGAIPQAIGNLTNLQKLNLQDNQLSGPIPQSICNLVNLQCLYLSGNKLSGSIPSAIGNLANLQELQLQNNQLSGRIPESMKALKSNVDISRNFFVKEEDIPGLWKCEESFRKGIDSPLEEALLLSIIGESERVDGKLVLSNIFSPGSEMEETMKRGEIPLGFSDSLVWPKILNEIKKFPKEQEEKENQLVKLKEQEKKILNKLKQLKKEKEKLEGILKDTQRQKKIVEKEIQPWLKFKESYFNQTCQFIQHAAEKEQQLAKRMDDCRLSEEEFTARGTGDAPLTLVFNAIGLSERSIEQLKFLDEYLFLRTTIQIECKKLDIPIREQFELVYCQKLWLVHGVFPNKRHEEECVVCSHNTPEELCDLIKEHEQVFDMDWIKREKITGRQFIGIPADSIRSMFPEKEEMRSTWIYFQRIHDQSLSLSSGASIRPKVSETPSKKPAGGSV